MPLKIEVNDKNKSTYIESTFFISAKTIKIIVSADETIAQPKTNFIFFNMLTLSA